MSPLGRRTSNAWFWSCYWGLVVLKGGSSAVEVLSNDKGTFLSQSPLEWQRQLDQSEQQQWRRVSSSSKSMGGVEFTCPAKTRDEKKNDKNSNDKMSSAKKRDGTNQEQHVRVLSSLSSPSHRRRLMGARAAQRHSSKRNSRKRTPPTTPCLTLGEVAIQEGLDILVQALEITGLLDVVLDPHNDLTVFAPTDHAFEQLGENVLQELTSTKTDLLAEILVYHVIGCTVTTRRLKSLQATPVTVPTLLLDDQDDAETVDLLVSRRRGRAIYVQGDGNEYKVLRDLPRVTQPNLKACNGVLHIVNRVVLPNLMMMNEEKEAPSPPPALSSSPAALLTIAGLAASVPELSILVTALQETPDLLAILSDPNADDLTVFAPVDDAFTALGQPAINYLLTNPDVLQLILLYHATPGVVTAREVIALDSFPTALDGQDVDVVLQGDSVFLQGVGNRNADNLPEVVNINNAALNGMVHLLNGVLLPFLPLGATLAVNGFSSLVEALEANDISDLKDPTTIFTIFAPSDEAIADFVPPTANADDFTSILLSHVIQGVILDSESVAAALAERPETSLCTMSGAMLTLATVADTVTIQGEGNDPTVSPPGTVFEFDIRGINGVIHAIDKVLLPSLEG